jgi:hypothetical protein
MPHTHMMRFHACFTESQAYKHAHPMSITYSYGIIPGCAAWKRVVLRRLAKNLAKGPSLWALGFTVKPPSL